MNFKKMYFDNSATTRVHKEVIEAMCQYYEEDYGNPSSLHKMGIIAEKAMRDARDIMANFLKVPNKTIYFTSGGTEGNNMSILRSIQKNKYQGNKIITTKIEHPSVLEVMKDLQGKGFDVIYLDVDTKGQINLQQLEEALDEKTILVSIMKVNNEVGSIQNMKEICRIIKDTAPQCIIHSDCVQALGKIPLFPLDEGIDIATFSAHKFHGPKGVGAMYINDNIKLPPLFFGGGQEGGLRSGTENVPGVVGMGKAIQLISKGFNHYQKNIYKLKEYCIIQLKEHIPEIVIISGLDGYSPHILSIGIKDTKGEVLLHMLEDKGIYVSTGSACSSNKKSEKYVLKSLGVDNNVLDGSIRISFSQYNTTQEIDGMVKVLKESVEFLKRFTRR